MQHGSVLGKGGTEQKRALMPNSSVHPSSSGQGKAASLAAGQALHLSSLTGTSCCLYLQHSYRQANRAV